MEIFDKVDVVGRGRSSKGEGVWAVMRYENPDVVERLQHKMSLSRPQADELFADLLRFLAMSGLGRQRYVPPRNIDDAWHHFLLFSEDYAAFCYGFFGTFLHHRPSTSASPMRGQQIPQTIADAGRLFGRLSSNWTAKWLESDACDGGTTNCQVCYR